MSSLAMSDNGRVLIPAELREELGFKPKSKVYIEVKDGSLILTSAKQRSINMRKFFAEMLPPTPGRSTVDEFIAERRAEAAREDAQ